MKKILSILMILALVGGVAFAQLTPSVEASAAVNWGIDLGAGKDAKAQHGFENVFDAKVVVPLYMGTLNSKNEGSVHMNFDLGLNLAYRFKKRLSNSASPFDAWDSDAQIDLWRKTLSGMSASVHFFGGYINVFGRPDFSTNFAQIWSPIRDDGTAWGPETSGDITGFGTKLGYKSDNLAGTGLSLDAGLKLGSNGAWNTKGEEAVPGKKIYKKVTFEKDYELKAEDLAKKVYKSKETGVDGNVVLVFDGAADTLANHYPTWAVGHKITEAESKLIFFEEAVSYDGKKDKKDPVANKYAIGFDLSLGYDKWVTLDFGINAIITDVEDFVNAGVAKDVAAGSKKDAMYLGTGFKLGSKAVEGLDVKLAMDTLMNVGKDSKVAFDLRFDAAYKWVAFGAYFGNDLSAYAGKDKGGKAIGDMAMMLAFKSAASGDTNLVNGLAFGVDFRLNHILSEVKKDNKSTLPMGLSAWVNYKYNITDAMWVKPYANFWAESNKTHKDTTNTDKFFGVAYKVGAVFSPVEKVEVEASWMHGKLAWNQYEGEGMLSAPAVDAHNGTLVLGVKVNY
ncbi:MSP porin [Treponema sp. OMZ 787]|uniref:major outer sheath protein Msp n=1 Tax=Treponema sp. OMZ 787 TaxID=2563669 RepID=UPI0020A5F969|nr:MSP porin [Treponema sp. OMZ 787]UTC62471.1 MSP porin [Treponema sp. OMZ 787]